MAQERAFHSSHSFIALTLQLTVHESNIEQELNVKDIRKQKTIEVKEF